MAKFLSWQGLEEYTGLIKTFVNNLHNDLTGKINGKADSSHTHPISNIENLQSSLNSKSDSDHKHDDLYDTKGAASSAISAAASDATTKANAAEANAKTYTNTKTSGLASTTVVDNKISSHNTSDAAHNDIRGLIDGLTTRLNALADSDDTTLDQLSEIVAYIKSNKSLIDDVTTNKVNVSDIVNNLTTNVSNEPLSAAQGVVIKTLIDALEEELDSHTHKYAESSSVGGAATSANKLNANAGSGTQPVYFANGVPVATTYSLGKSVPSDAKFTDTTYSVATTEANGLMSADDKKKIGSVTGTTYTFGAMGSKTIADLRNALDHWLNLYSSTANATAIFSADTSWITAWNSGDTSTTLKAGVQWTVTNIATYSTKAYTQLRISTYGSKHVYYVARENGTWGNVSKTAFKDEVDLKQDKITGGATTITGSNLTASRALVSDANGKVAVSAVTSTELSYLDNAKSNIQEQIDGKSDSTHTHNTTYIPDTRTENMTPIEYINKYPKQVITEFKQQNSIGLSNSASYCKLTTYVQWANNSGGYPSQEAIIDGRLFTRQGTSDTTWGAWKTNVDSGNIGSQSVASATTASKVTVTATNPSSQTGYYFPFHSGSDTGNKSLLTNDGIKYLSQQGTTSAAGAGDLILGNGIASGAAGNKKGGLTMFGTSSGYTYISPTNNTTNNIAVNLPSTGGTLALNTAATQSANGLMSAADKKKLDGIATGANKITVDTALSGTSTNPVQNKVINAALAGKADAHSHPYLSTSGGTLSGNLVATGYSIEAGTLYSYGHVTAAGDMSAKTIYENGTALSSKYAPLSHTHDDRYYTGSQVDAKLAGKATLNQVVTFAGVSLGNGNPYIYTENNNINFRWYWNNTWRYYSMEDIYNKLVAGGAITHGYLTLQNDAITSSTNSVSLRRNGSSTDGFMVAGNCRPLADNSMTSGSSSYRWKQLYAATTTINTSDRNAKRDFRTFDSNENYEKFFMDLKPLVFKFKDGESKRDHFGFVSQDVEDSLYKYNFDDKSFAGFCKDVKVEYIEDEDGNGEEIPVLDENGNEQYIYGLRYGEFTAFNTWMIQKLVKKNEVLEARISQCEVENQELKAEIAEIKKMIAELKG